MAASGFCAGWVLLAAGADDLFEFFYQPRPLAATHAFTLGWATFAITGVLYQYVPSLTKTPVSLPRLVPVQIALLFAGTVGLVAHFWIGRTVGMAWSAALLWGAALLLAIQLLPPLLRAEKKDATVVGLVAALSSFVGTATLGFLYALDKHWSFLPGSVLTNIAAHAHLGLLAWISVCIQCVSYRMISAFVLPDRPLPESARHQIVTFTVAAWALSTALAYRSASWITVTGAMVVATLLWHVSLFADILRRRRLPVDWSILHCMAALGHLAAAATVGAFLVLAVDTTGEFGSRLVTVYGLLVLTGWISNYIFGVGARLMPGLSGLRPRTSADRPADAVVFFALNAAVVLAVMAVISGRPGALRIAAVPALVGVAVFAVRTLAPATWACLRTDR